MSTSFRVPFQPALAAALLLVLWAALPLATSVAAATPDGPTCAPDHATDAAPPLPPELVAPGYTTTQLIAAIAASAVPSSADTDTTANCSASYLNTPP